MNLYRHFDKTGKLLYVGISISTLTRLSQHSNNSVWFDSIYKVEIEKFSSRMEAQEAERIAIKKEKPEHNIIRAEPKSDKIKRLNKIFKLSENSADDLTARITRFDLLYSDSSIKKIMSVQSKAIEKWIADGWLGFITIPNNSKAGFKRMFTGWQLITLLEILERRSNDDKPE